MQKLIFYFYKLTFESSQCMRLLISYPLIYWPHSHFAIRSKVPLDDQAVRISQLVIAVQEHTIYTPILDHSRHAESFYPDCRLTYI